MWLEVRRVGGLGRRGQSLEGSTMQGATGPGKKVLLLDLCVGYIGDLQSPSESQDICKIGSRFYLKTYMHNSGSQF